MENQNEKLYGGLVIFAVKEEDKPQVGDTVQIEHLNNDADAEAFGIKRGEGIYLVQKDSLISQVNGYTLSKAKEFNSLFGKRKANATVVSEQSITLANGKPATMLIIEADKPVVKVKQKDGSEGTIIEFSGTTIDCPDRSDFYNVLTTNPDALENNLTVVKNGAELILMFGDKKIGKNSKEDYLKMFKMFEGQNIPVTYKETSRGLIKICVNQADLTVDYGNTFADDIARVESIGINREKPEKAIKAMTYYDFEPQTIKAVLAGWKKYDELGESLIPSIDDVIKEIEGKTYYSYIDTKEVMHDLAGWILFKTPIRLVGPMSAGKNLALKVAAAIFRRPMLRLSCNGFTDDTVLLGNTTLKEGVVEFEPGLPILAAQKGYWIVLDEINATPADSLIALHALLENEDGTINIKEIGKVVPAEDFRIFATMNANDDNNLYAGTKDMNAALESRFTTIYMDNELSIKEILKNKCVSASDADINKVVSVYNSLAVLTKDPTKDFPESFIAVRAYVDILNGPAIISLKKRCIQKLANLNTADPVYREYVEQTVEDIFGK